jgi:hypothetical protein
MTMPGPNNRNSVSGATMLFYVAGVLSAFIGIYVSTITQIYIFTGNETHPYLGIGIPLFMAGLVVVAATQRIAKRNLSR